MTDSPNSEEVVGTEADRFQFSIRQLLLLISVAAAIAAAASSLSAPKFVQAVFAAYLILAAAYGILRLPYICRKVFRRTPRSSRLRHRRAGLEAFARSMKQQVVEARFSAKTDPPESGSSPDPTCDPSSL
jgi:hypothetical protein